MTLPIICELTPETLRTRRRALLPGLVARADQRAETAEGYTLTFLPSADIVQALFDL